MSSRTSMRPGWPCCKKAPHVPTTSEPRLPKKDASIYQTSCIAVHTTLAEIVACGPWNWPHRSVSSKVSSPQRYPPKVCVEPSNDSKPIGSVPSTGLPAPTHWTYTKKRTRPVDGLGQPRAYLGSRLPGRGVVESFCFASSERLAGRG